MKQYLMNDFISKFKIKNNSINQIVILQFKKRNKTKKKNRGKTTL